MEATVPIQDITFCIKTIHRPWACHRLVQSLRKEFGEPKIVVVDDGLPEHWFSRKYPETAKHCKVIDLQQHDVGVGIGRNTAIDAAETEFIFLLDDDQIVTPDLHLDRVYQRFMEYGLDILAVRQGAGGYHWPDNLPPGHPGHDVKPPKPPGGSGDAGSEGSGDEAGSSDSEGC